MFNPNGTEIAQFEKHQADASRYTKERNLSKDTDKQAELTSKIDFIDSELKRLMPLSGYCIRSPDKSRLTIQRGYYYNHRNAVMVEDVIRNAIINDEYTETGVKGHTARTAIQMLRQGLDFLTENLDPTGEFTLWSDTHQFIFRKEKVYIRKHGTPTAQIPLAVTRWEVALSQWMSMPGAPTTVTMTFTNLHEYEKMKEKLTKFGIEVLSTSGWTATVGFAINKNDD